MFRRRLRSLALGFALLAALGQALLPLHATAMALGEWRDAAGICSTDGLPGGHLSHGVCPWCVLSSGGALPGPAPAPIPASGPRLLAPPPGELLGQGPRLTSAQPRAPPSLS
jgi:hypothetical protein